MGRRPPRPTPQLCCLSHELLGRFRTLGTKNCCLWPWRPGETQESYLGPGIPGPLAPPPPCSVVQRYCKSSGNLFNPSTIMGLCLPFVSLSSSLGLSLPFCPMGELDSRSFQVLPSSVIWSSQGVRHRSVTRGDLGLWEQLRWWRVAGGGGCSLHWPFSPTTARSPRSPVTRCPAEWGGIRWGGVHSEEARCRDSVHFSLTLS